MKFDETIDAIGTQKDLRRVASAYVVDYRNLNETETKEALRKVKPQYLHYDNIATNLYNAFYNNDSPNLRALSQLIIREILLNEDGFILKAHETEERVMSLEQKIINRSNEIDISDLAARANMQRKNDLELYYFVLQVAWEYQNTKSPDEVNLLLKLRNKLNIHEIDNWIMEAKLGKFPKPNNELHNRGEIREARRFLHGLGILFPVRTEKDGDLDVIPEELALQIRNILKKEIKEPNYHMLVRHKLVFRKSFLTATLEKSSCCFNPGDTLNTLAEKVILNIQPSVLLGGTGFRDGLSTEDLHKWCFELNLPVSGTKQERIERIINYYDSLRQTTPQPEDNRVIWYDVYEKLAFRDYSTLRAQNIITKDNEIESKFEEATAYLFQHRLNHTPLKQVGANSPDGLLSFKDMYVMWDNKSKESPGLVNLKDHIKQFHEYMEKANKQVPIFFVIAPAFTEESELVAIKYTSEHLNRNIVLITAEELKCLAEKWSNSTNERHDEPFPLGLLARAGRFNAKLLETI